MFINKFYRNPVEDLDEETIQNNKLFGSKEVFVNYYVSCHFSCMNCTVSE